MGEVIKIFWITSSGSEGIDLKNTRYVHIMEPYWRPVRPEQVIGRARRFKSHIELPKEYQTVEVFIYIMIFSKQQLDSDDAIELKKYDVFNKPEKGQPSIPFTSDQYLYAISENKAQLTTNLINIIKETSFDCSIYPNGHCVNFENPTETDFAYIPDYTNEVEIKKVTHSAISTKGARIISKKLNGGGGGEGENEEENERKSLNNTIQINQHKYEYEKIKDNFFNIFDIKNHNKIATLQITENGEKIFKHSQF